MNGVSQDEPGHIAMSVTPATAFHVIIGGTIKGATSSLFSYLADHPEVCASRIKETFFFSRDYGGQPEADRERYARLFDCSDDHRVLLEASPNYLGFTENVAPRIRKLLPNARLIFVLRNPVERFYSHYRFSRSKFDLPEQMSIEEFYDRCREYSDGGFDPAQTDIRERSLRALEIGRYGKHLRRFYDVFDAAQIKVVFFDDLRTEPVRFMTEVCDFIGIDPGFFRNYAFERHNVTFAVRRKILHRLVMIANRLLESTLRRRPRLKRQLVEIYRRLNQGRDGNGGMSDEMRQALRGYYADSNRELASMLQGSQLPPWLESSIERPGAG